ncbi:hypothetical protein [Rhizobium grahamii]|uniref:Uncharacterized protein n=1 Tax=Rhizobium grahamii CCGE 502 TaxID=990285 RepID=S3HE25_9HYPH|nr:hypothetical protein [Rhizobium grahamii]EPE96979.1 hypothetical protein RGCCGE502_17450 [Rhizobium grahamii CCGE 502]
MYEKFGGIGIKMCERWAGSFTAFLGDMGERPPGTILGRLEESGDFEPSNCVWTSKRRPVAYEDVFVTFQGADISLLQLANVHQVNSKQLLTRIKFLGEDADEAIRRLKQVQ